MRLPAIFCLWLAMTFSLEAQTGVIEGRAQEQARLRLYATNLLTGEKIHMIGAAFRFDNDDFWNEVDGDEVIVPSLINLELQIGSRGYKDSAIQQVSPLQPGEVREIAIPLRPIQLGCIAGALVDQHGVPISCVRVQPSRRADSLRFDPGVSSTDKNGKFKFDGLQPGDYVISPHAEVLGYEPGFYPELGESSEVSVAPGAGCAAITIKLGPKAAKLQLTVLDAVTQMPIQDAAIVLVGESGGDAGGWSISTHEDAMSAPALKPFQLSVGARGYETSTIAVSPLQPEEVQKIAIHLQSDLKK